LNAGDTLDDRQKLSEEELLDWLRLIRSSNIGPRTFHDLVGHCGSVRAAIVALPELARRGGSTRSIRICSKEAAEAELTQSRARGIEFLALGEPNYPLRLRMIDDPPPLIAMRGSIEVLARCPDCRLAWS
jgi:DNA processing protein